MKKRLLKNNKVIIQKLYNTDSKSYYIVQISNLTNKLKEVLPKDLDYVFYSDSGSVGVEVSLNNEFVCIAVQSEVTNNAVIRLLAA